MWLIAILKMADKLPAHSSQETASISVIEASKLGQTLDHLVPDLLQLLNQTWRKPLKKLFPGILLG